MEARRGHLTLGKDLHQADNVHYGLKTWGDPADEDQGGKERVRCYVRDTPPAQHITNDSCRRWRTPWSRTILQQGVAKGAPTPGTGEAPWLVDAKQFDF